MPAISIKNINKTYIDQDGNEVQALHDINLDVAEGESEIVAELFSPLKPLQNIL